MRIKTRLIFVVVAFGLAICTQSLQAQSGRQANAIWIRDSAKVANLTYHTSGISSANSTARQNIVDTAKCQQAHTSWYGDVGDTLKWLHSTMLSTIHTLCTTYGYSILVTEYAGGDHSSGSYHYSGTAYDVATINGRGVSSSNPYWKTFNQRNRDRGSIESLGPGFPGHDTHVHNAWPSGTSNSQCCGCVADVSAPSNLNATTVDNDSIKVTWVDHSSIETHFELQKSGTSGTGPWSVAATLGANVESYTVNGLGAGKKYWFRVKAYNSNDNSPWSNVDNATTKENAPSAPAGLTATAVSNDQINLAWGNVSNEDGFRIYRSTDNVTYALIKTVGVNVVTYNNTGLTGNRKYYFRVKAYNTGGNSAYSNTASDTTAPQAPTALTATAGSGDTWNTINLNWTDNSSSEAGFKIERSTSSGSGFTQIATNAASDHTYTSTGLSANTTYYFRVRAYNGNGNSDYSNTASSPTGNAPPVLGAIGNKTVAQNVLLTFTATATDPNQTVTTTTWENFESYTNNTPDEYVMFKKPLNSGSTSAFIDSTATNYTRVTTSFPTGHSSAKVMKVGWTFKTGQVNPWVRLVTLNTSARPNPCIDGAQIVRFDVNCTKALKVAVGCRETGTAVAYGANGGTTGTIDWAGVTNVVSSAPLANHQIAANTWTTISLNIPFEPQASFTGDGSVNLAKVALEHMVLGAVANAGGSYVVYLDNFAVVAQNTLTYSMVGAPTGAAINAKTGKFTWTPTGSQVGAWNFTVKVTDQLGAIDTEAIRVTVTSTGNAAPVLNAIGSKTVNELSALTFTASATDANAGQTLTYSLDAGYPTGASIGSSSGAFTWTPTEAQGAGSYPITVRVTDNGAPASNDFETITVTVKEVNVAPVLAAISDQTANELQAFTYTPSTTDSDLPAQTMTYSLVSAPEGMTINSSSGQISWTPTEVDGPDTNQVTIQVKDNGSPALLAERTFNVIVNEVNTAPTLTLGTTVLTGIPITDLETFPVDTVNGTVLFRQPSFSSSTTAFLETAPIWSSVTDVFPEGVAGSRVLYTYFAFKTGQTNPWLRLTTFNTTGGYFVPNPTVDFTKKIRFSIYSDRSIKVALGLRETGTSASLGADGGTSGTLEWLGATLLGTSPVPSRTVDATNWTTLEFDPTTDTVTAFPGSGNGVLSSATGKGVLEHLAIVPNDGTGVYNIYVDNLEILQPSATFAVDSGKALTLTNAATDTDIPANVLTFSLETNAPANAVIDSKSGTFTWTPSPDQGGTTNTFGIRVTDDGVPPLSDVKNVTIVVNDVNTAPRMVQYLKEFFVNPFELVEYEATATDDDLPGDTLTYSFIGTPLPGSTLDSATGHFTWTPTTANGTNITVVRATDSGTPALYDELTIVIVSSPTNIAPVLGSITARATESVVSYETFTNNTPNEQVMFKKPSNSSTTSAFVDTTAANSTVITTSFPAGNANAGAKVLKADWTFKTGLTDYWVRLTTANTTLLPNPVFDCNARLKFDVYSSKSIKVALGIRETGTNVENGANGGIVGTIEYVGASTKQGNGCPNPTRTVNANTWTTLEFDIPNEPKVGFTGDGTLNPGQQTLEHLVLVGNGGSGAYTVHLDNFEVVNQATLPGSIAMKSGTTLGFTATATDADSNPLTFGLEEGAPTGATIDPASGVFSWVPATSYDGTTNDITPYVEDYPLGGYQAKRDSQTLTVTVSSDTLGPK